MAFTISTVEKTITLEDENLAQLWQEWQEWQATEERSGRERSSRERIVDRATVLAEIEESNVDYVVDVNKN